MKIKIIPIFCAALAFASCQKQDTKDWSANAPLSKVFGKSTTESFNWQTGDVISVYSESDLGKFTGQYACINNGQTGTFQPFSYSMAADKADKYCACFPAGHIDFSIGEGEFPSEYDCSENRFRGLPMSAYKVNKTTENSGVLGFKPCASAVEFTFSSAVTFNVKSITLTSDVFLSGKGKCSMDRTIPYVILEEGSKSVKYNYEGVSVKGSKTFTMTIPGKISMSELSFSIESEEGKVLTKKFSGFDSEFGMTYKFSYTNPGIYKATIYSSPDKYTSFVDLIWYKDRYYCAFREGFSHVPLVNDSENGDIRILETFDCRTWKESTMIADPAYDLRDPHFCISPIDGSLLCYYAYHKVGEPWVKPHKTVVTVLEQENGKLVEKKTEGVEQGDKYNLYWIWNITSHEDKIYGIGYHETGTFPTFMESTDGGFTFELVSEIPFLGNESSVNIIDGKAYVLMRNQTDNQNASMAIASKPYTSWDITSLNYGMHSPVGREYNNKLYLCGRKYAKGLRDGVSLFYYNLPTDVTLKEYCRLPNDKPAQDNAYPGMIIHDGALRIVYYGIPDGKYIPDIYYYEIPLELLD